MYPEVLAQWGKSRLDEGNITQTVKPSVRHNALDWWNLMLLEDHRCIYCCCGTVLRYLMTSCCSCILVFPAPFALLTTFDHLAFDICKPHKPSLLLSHGDLVDADCSGAGTLLDSGSWLSCDESDSRQ